MPFTPAEIDARMRDLRRIAEPIVEHYRSDLDRDDELLRHYALAPRFVWVPYDSGTHLAAVTPAGRDWLQAIAHVVDRTLTPYLVTPSSVRPTTWAHVDELLQATPAPVYEVRDAIDGRLVHTTESSDDARHAWHEHPRPARLRQQGDPADRLSPHDWLDAHPHQRHRWSDRLPTASAPPASASA
jgi:hypothetical protein